MRDGVPLPGTTPVAVLSQLAHRVFGPLRGNRVRATLDYHGLTGRSADRTIVVASRHGISDTTLTTWVRTLAGAGRRLPLSVELATEICRRSAADEDHLGRTRAAKTFGFAPPGRPARPTTGKIPTPGPTNAERSAAHIAGRVLAAAGPQDIEVLRAAVERAGRTRHRIVPGPDELAAALKALAAEADDHGRWHAPPDFPVSGRYRALADHIGDRTLTRREMTGALVAVGYTATYAEMRAINSHPLIRRVGANRYRLIGGDS